MSQKTKDDWEIEKMSNEMHYRRLEFWLKTGTLGAIMIGLIWQWPQLQLARLEAERKIRKPERILADISQISIRSKILAYRGTHHSRSLRT